MRSLLSMVSRTLFARRFGVETTERYVYHEPAEWRTLQRILPRREVAGKDVFIDLGSGRGRMVVQAAERYPFRRGIGVERSPALDAAARRNLGAARRRLRCRDVRLVQADVLEFELPDEVTIVFLNNPFTDEVFDGALASVVRSLKRRPRRLRIIYRNPVAHERLMAGGRFRQAGQWRRRYPRSVVIDTYEAAPPRIPA